MKTRLLVGAVFMLMWFVIQLPAAEMYSDSTLIYAYRPIIHQDTADVYYSETGTYSEKGDWLTPIDFDGDWNTSNNWENLPNYFNNMPTPKVYTYVLHEGNYTFIGYLFYHPRDYESIWGIQINNDLVSHENDLEGIWIVIENTGGYGTPLAMVTKAHYNYYEYAWDGCVYGDQSSIDGQVQYVSYHPKVWIEAEGHGVYGDNRTNYGDGTQKYYSYYSYNTESFTKSGSYALIGSHYEYLAADGDGDRTRLYGDTYGDNAACVPWGWNADDGAAKGGLYLYPLTSAKAMFNGHGL